jgi:hypothetical protein
MDEIAPEYDVIVLGTGTFLFPSSPVSATRRIPASENFGLMLPFYCISKRMLTVSRIDRVYSFWVRQTASILTALSCRKGVTDLRKLQGGIAHVKAVMADCALIVF